MLTDDCALSLHLCISLTQETRKQSFQSEETSLQSEAAVKIGCVQLDITVTTFSNYVTLCLVVFFRQISEPQSDYVHE